MLVDTMADTVVDTEALATEATEAMEVVSEVSVLREDMEATVLDTVPSEATAATEALATPSAPDLEAVSV